MCAYHSFWSTDGCTPWPVPSTTGYLRKKIQWATTKIRDEPEGASSFRTGHTWSSHPHSKARTTLYNIMNSTKGKYCSVPFISMVRPQDFTHTLKRQNHLVQHNKQCHKRVLLSSFHLNGHTIGFHTQTLKIITTLYNITKFTGTTGKYCSVNFIWMVTP